jgi:hypothetical protein
MLFYVYVLILNITLIFLLLIVMSIVFDNLSISMIVHLLIEGLEIDDYYSKKKMFATFKFYI